MNAPRTIEELAKLTPVAMRQLTEMHLAAQRTDEEKMAWFGLNTPEAKAHYMLTLLKRWDEANGVVEHMNGAAPQASRAPVTNGASAPAATTGFIPAVAPAAVAVAQAATMDTGKAKATRQPKTSEDKAAPDLGADILKLLGRVLEGQEALGKRFETALETASSAKNSRLEATCEALIAQNKSLAEMLTSISYQQTWALMALLTYVADQNETSVIDLLRTTIGTSENFQGLATIARGKA
jgi:hypothetical protein